MPEVLSAAVLLSTVAVLCMLLPFASHRTYLLLLSRKKPPDVPERWVGPLPRVTIQLPVFNERTVVERLIDAACAVDYPRHLLEIQVLDDSDDETTVLAARVVCAWRARGTDVVHIRRQTRQGFKAGALRHGTDLARGELIVVLDADFVAPERLILDLLPPFQDPGIGMVQARWGHLNEEESSLTRAQALLLDGHFSFEQGGRFAGGRFFNFNGTAGMWRRSCLSDAGGWTDDTLTEDLDLSYRAQLRGWRFAYLDDLVVPGELPASVAALEVQQRRWAQGGIQTARKILPSLLRGTWPLKVKIEAAIHLCGHLAHPLTLALALLLFPSAVARRSLGLDAFLVLDLVALMLASVPFFAFYAAAGRRRGRSWRALLPRVLGVLSLGIGLSAPVSRAVVRGLRRTRDPFVRTPKRGAVARVPYTRRRSGPDRRLVGAMALLMGLDVLAAMVGGYWPSIPFLLLFASGYGRLFVARRATTGPAPGPPGSDRLQVAHGCASTGPDVPDEQSPHGYPDQRPDPRGLRPVPGLVIGG